MINPHRLSERHWHISHAIALEIVLDETDINELRKAISYLRTISRHQDLGKHLLTYYQTLIRHGSTISHSNKTQKYYESLYDIFDYYLRQLLRQEFNDFEVVCQVLGWASGLAKYYETLLPKDGSKKAKIKNHLRQQLEDYQQAIKKSPSISSTSSPESAPNVIDMELKEGHILDAVATKKGSRNRVTYQCCGHMFNEREAKNYDKIPLNQPIKVEIKSLKDDGTINHIKFTEDAG
ncbi:MAG: Small acid-soluble spore protein P family [Phormidium sp. OSCR]|nr:MAG: Small acid-soluble spore protein P family [Phormidium sp. OSCR]